MIFDIALSLRRGEFGLDVIAALAMAGALVLGEHLAGIIVALMYTGGEALEDFAQRRARRDITALLNRVPQRATRYADGHLEEVDLNTLTPGDRLLIRRGEVVPVDGRVVGGVGVLDESALTGEALPVRRLSGESVTSGSSNAGEAIGDDGPSDMHCHEFERILHGLEAITRMHFALEEEIYRLLEAD
jgi:cation transport ATPase